MSEVVQDLNLEVIKKASEKFENIEEVFIDVEIDEEIKTFKVEIYKYFSPIQITQCITEFIEKIDLARKKDKSGFGNIMYPYAIFMIIKHFTTLKLPNDFNEQILTIEKMINTGLLFEIFMSFEQEEIEKIKSKLELTLANFDKNHDLLEKFKKEVEPKIENKFLLD